VRKFVIGAVSVAMVLGLSACGGHSQSGDDGGDKGLDGKGRTLDVWIMQGTNPSAKQFYADVKKAFEEKTGAKVNIEEVQWAAAQKKFTTAIEGGKDQVPDVAEVGTTWIPQFAETGALVDVSDKVDKAGLSSDLVSGLKEAGTLDGKQYGMPWYAGVRSLVYRKDIFEKHHLKAPTSWKEMRATAQKLKKEEPDMIPFPVPGDNEFGTTPFIWGAGGKIATKQGDGWKSQLNSPESVKGLTYYTDLATKYHLSPAKATTWNVKGVTDAFSKGKVAMAVLGNWTPKALVEANPDLKGKLAAAPIPGPDGGLSPSFVGGSYLSVFNTDNKELAWELVKMMTTGKLADEWAEQTNYFPGTNSGVQKMADQGGPLVEPFATQMVKGGTTVPKTPAYGKVQAAKVIPKMVQSVLKGSSPQDAADQAAKEMDAIFAKSE
jgi:N,N'-diacetylchitobiose transport system substrate-binding protein